MTAIITEKFRLHNAEQFFESFSEAANSTYYLFIGHNIQTSSSNDHSLMKLNYHIIIGRHPPLLTVVRPQVQRAGS